MNNIKAIHTLKNKLGLSEEIYRTMLFETFQKSSSKDLSDKQQSQLIAMLNSQIISTRQANSSTYKQLNYISFLSKGKIRNLTSYCSKIIGKSINSIDELTKNEAKKVIDSLLRYHRSKSESSAIH